MLHAVTSAPIIAEPARWFAELSIVTGQMAMAAAESSPGQTEGKWDGRPVTLVYKPGDSDDSGLHTAEGYKVCKYDVWAREHRAREGMRGRDGQSLTC